MKGNQTHTKGLNYEEHLRKLNLPTLQYRRMRGHKVFLTMLKSGRSQLIITIQILMSSFDKRVQTNYGIDKNIWQ